MIVKVTSLERMNLQDDLELSLGSSCTLDPAGVRDSVGREDIRTFTTSIERNTRAIRGWQTTRRVVDLEKVTPQ